MERKREKERERERKREKERENKEKENKEKESTQNMENNTQQYTAKLTESLRLFSYRSSFEALSTAQSSSFVPFMIF